jgi:hypothetical protein
MSFWIFAPREGKALIGICGLLATDTPIMRSANYLLRKGELEGCDPTLRGLQEGDGTSK